MIYSGPGWHDGHSRAWPELGSGQLCQSHRCPPAVWHPAAFRLDLCTGLVYHGHTELQPESSRTVTLNEVTAGSMGSKASWSGPFSASIAPARDTPVPANAARLFWCRVQILGGDLDTLVKKSLPDQGERLLGAAEQHVAARTGIRLSGRRRLWAHAHCSAGQAHVVESFLFEALPVLRARRSVRAITAERH
jgi:hypothetical protein